MQTLTFSLEFDDGQVVTAQMEAESNCQDAPVQYSGPVDRLPFAPASASSIEMRAYLQSFARELGARLGEQLQNNSLPSEPEQTQTPA